MICQHCLAQCPLIKHVSFQQGRWQWHDSSPTLDVFWHGQYEGAPNITTLTQYNDNSEYVKETLLMALQEYEINVTEIQSANYTTDDNIELCTAGNVILGSTKIGLSVVNCSKPMLLYTFCNLKPRSEGDEGKVNLNTQHHGYSLHLHNESNILTAKHSCGGFTHMIEDTCFMFIQLVKFTRRGVA